MLAKMLTNENFYIIKKTKLSYGTCKAQNIHKSTEEAFRSTKQNVLFPLRCKFLIKIAFKKKLHDADGTINR